MRTDHHPHLAGRSVALVLACAALAIPAGASTQRAHAPTGPVWPAPPDPPRIRYVGSVATDRDPGAKRSWTDRVRGFVLGERASRLGRPVGIWAGSDGTVLVCDPATATVFEIRTRDGSMRPFVSGGRLATPVGVTRMPDHTTWICDADRGVILRYDERGVWKGEAGAGLLVRPTGIAYDPVRDRLYVADAQAHHIAVFDGQGRHLTDLGQRGTGDGEFNFPTDVKVTSSGDLMVCDALNCRVERISPDGAFRGRFGRSGDGRGDFARPKGVALDGDGHVYVVDALFDVMQIFDADGMLLLVVGCSGVGDGQFNLPSAVAIDAQDRIYVSDSANRRLQVFEYLRPPGGIKR